MKHVAVVGASGAVGERMIRLLEERDFPLASIRFLASERSAGKTVEFRGESHPIGPLSAEAFEGVDIVLSSTPASVSRQLSPIAAQAGAVVVDNSSAFRMEPDVPLVVPEVNPHDVAQAPGDHRQPQLLDDPDGRGPEALARRLPDPPGGRQHLSVGLGSRAEGDPRARVADAAAHRGRGRAGAVEVRPPDRWSTASRRSTTSSPRVTPRRR